jgi:hypothetical protein
MARPLREGVEALELTSKFTLAVLALASGVYTFLGVRDLLDGSATVVFLAARLYSAAVSVGIYAFWTFLLRLMPHVRHSRHRVALVGTILLGSAMIVAMSAWLNAAALAGSAAIEQHLSRAAEGYADALDKAHANALAAQSLLPDIQLASERFARLADDERTSGALTGTTGSGTVVQLLTQMSNDLKGLGDEITASRDTVKTLYDEGSQHISKMRALVSAQGSVTGRADAFGEEAVALAGVVTSLQQTSVAPAVRRAADDLASSFIAPVADGGTEDLRTRQQTVVGSVASAVSAQSKQLAQAADQILAAEQVRVERFVPISRPDAVLRYAADFLPSWAGAISIDLMPAVLVLILVAVHGAIRRDEDPEVAENVMTAADMMQAMRLYERMRREEIATERLSEPKPPAAAAAPAEEAEPTVPPAPAVPPAPPIVAAERSDPTNVTPLSPQRGRGEAG